MNLSLRRLFFPKWFLVFLLGGVLGFLIPYLGSPWALVIGALFLWGFAAFLYSSFQRNQSIIIKNNLNSLSGSPLISSLEGQVEKTSDPLGNLVREMSARIIQLETEAKSSSDAKPDFSMQEFYENLEPLIKEQEKMIQSFYAFKDVIQEWSSNIDKAGRINKSLLQLNELIVNDSKKVAVDTDAAAKSATDGIKSVGKEIKAMTEIKATIGSSAEVIQQLNLASEQIGDFLATITSIARKTNLLALNAGIEAARAGEHGTGFAVVASEIKILAEASAKAAGDVKHLVDDIRMKTTNAISLISTTGKIEENVNVVYSAGDVFMTIVKSVRKAGGLLGEISQALEDQRNDNELLVQLLGKIHMAGDQVKDKFELAQVSLDQVQKMSWKIKEKFENIKSNLPPG